MTIRGTFNAVYGALLALAGMLAVLAVLLFVNQRRFEASEEERFRSFALAEELRQTGEELTRFARSYVVTGDERFRRSFRDIAAIRNGQQPRPVHYERIYWDYIAAGRTPPRGYGPAVPLLTLLREAGVTGPEFAKLAEAESRSDALTRIEEAAMAARATNVSLAIRLTHDQTYHDAIADIRTPIDEFFGMLDARTASTVAAYARRSTLYLLGILVICAAMIVLKLGMFIAARRRIWIPVSALQRQVQDVGNDLGRLAGVAARIARGERDARFIVSAQPLGSRAPDEIGQLTRQHDAMIARLQDTGTSISTLTASQTARFDQLFEQAPEGVVLLDADDRVVRVNGEFTRLFGYPGAEAQGRLLNDLVVPAGVEDGASLIRIRSLQDTRDRVSFDVVRRTKAGALLPVSVLGVPVDVDSAEIKGLAIYRDITERRQAEAARADLARLEALRGDVHRALASGGDVGAMLQQCTQAMVDRMEAAFARIWISDDDQRMLVLRASAGQYTRLDGSHSRIPIGQWKIGLIAQERQPHATNDVLHDPRISDPEWARREGMTAFAGYPLLAAGRVVGVMAVFSRAPIGEGALTTFASVADAIAEGVQRRQAEQALQRSERALRQLIETIPDLVWSAAPDGTVDQVNQRVLDYNGKTLADLPNNGWLSVIHPDDVEGAIQSWMHAVTTGEPYATEFRHRRADGVYRWFSSRALPLRDREGRIVRWYGLLSDIEDSRNAATALLEARGELAHIARATTIGEFAASIAHEVNQPLAAVVANASAGRRWLTRKAPDIHEAKEAFQRITRDAKRASDVIGGMRALMQRGTGETEPVDLTRVVRDVLDLVEPEIARQRVALHRSFAADLPRVRGDRIQLQQVVLNLVTNAVQALGGVTERARQLWIDVAPAGDAAHPEHVVTVRDNGPGLGGSESRRLFDAFYTTKAGGLGMGLAISRSIIEAHGGRIWAAENPEGGASFCFALPLEA